MVIDYLLKDSGDISNDVWVKNNMLNVIVGQTHNSQLLS